MAMGTMQKDLKVTFTLDFAKIGLCIFDLLLLLTGLAFMLFGMVSIVNTIRYYAGSGVDGTCWELGIFIVWIFACMMFAPLRFKKKENVNNLS